MRLPEWPTARDWIGLGTFGLTVMILWMMKGDHSLMGNDFFKTIATLIIGTGFINGPVSWAYSSSKAGGELAATNAEIVRKQVADTTTPQPVTVENTEKNPVPVETK